MTAPRILEAFDVEVNVEEPKELCSGYIHLSTLTLSIHPLLSIHTHPRSHLSTHTYPLHSHHLP